MQTNYMVEVSEAVLIENIQQAEWIYIHFYEEDFEYCDKLNDMLEEVARDHQECKFVKILATKAGFFVNKYNIQILPFSMIIRKGAIIKTYTGLEEFGNEFPTVIMLKLALSNVGCIRMNDDEYLSKHAKVNVQKKRKDKYEDDDW